MTTEDAARRWAETWERAWPAGDTDAIAALYSDDATYRALAFRTPDHGLAGVRRYLETNFAVERETECWFAEPLVAGDVPQSSGGARGSNKGSGSPSPVRHSYASTTRDASSITATIGTRSTATSRRTTAGASDRRGSTRSTHLRDGRFSG